jgi:tetratricopeptide (TPR) repeat protein
MRISTESRLLLCALVVATSVAACAGNGTQVISRDSEYQRMLDLQRAKAEYYAAEEKTKDVPEATWQTYARLGDQYAKQGNDMMAYIQYTKALQIDPSQLGVRYRLGQMYVNRGMLDEGVREFNQILAKAPGNALAYQGLALAAMAKGELAQSKDYLSKAITLEPKLWQAHAYLGMAYDREKAFDRAADNIKRPLP